MQINTVPILNGMPMQSKYIVRVVVAIADNRHNFKAGMRVE